MIRRRKRRHRGCISLETRNTYPVVGIPAVRSRAPRLWPVMLMLHLLKTLVQIRSNIWMTAALRSRARRRPKSLHPRRRSGRSVSMTAGIVTVRRHCSRVTAGVKISTGFRKSPDGFGSLGTGIPSIVRPWRRSSRETLTRGVSYISELRVVDARVRVRKRVRHGMMRWSMMPSRRDAKCTLSIFDPQPLNLCQKFRFSRLSRQLGVRPLHRAPVSWDELVRHCRARVRCRNVRVSCVPRRGSRPVISSRRG